MFGISSKDTQLLENIINEIFDITSNKRNSFRYSKSEFSNNSLKKIKKVIESFVATN